MSNQAYEPILTNIPILRDACDTCHKRKMRCPAQGVGACMNCRRTGQVCQYSPRDEMGRPRGRSGPLVGRKARALKPDRKSRSSSGARAGSMATTPPPNIDPEAMGAYYKTPSDSTKWIDTEGLCTSQPTPLISTMAPYTQARILPTISANVAPLSVPLGDVKQWPGTMIQPSTVGAQSVPVPVEVAHYIRHRDIPASKHPQSYSRPGVMTPGPLLPSPGGCYYQAYCRLFSILSGIRCFASGLPEMRNLTSEPCQGTTLDQLFEQVSILCDTIAWLTKNMPPLPSATDSNPKDASATQNFVDPIAFFVVVTSILSTVISLYSERLSTYRRLSEGPSNKRAPGLTPQHRIQILTNATTMEFHLGALKRSLKDGVSLGICDAKTLDDLNALRIEVKGFVDACRCTES